MNQSTFFPSFTCNDLNPTLPRQCTHNYPMQLVRIASKRKTKDFLGELMRNLSSALLESFQLEMYIPSYQQRLELEFKQKVPPV